MNQYLNPLENPSYSELFLKNVNSHITYFGTTVKLYRSIVSHDSDYEMYQQTVQKARKYRQAELVKAIVNWDSKENSHRPRLTNSAGLFTEHDVIPAFFKTTDLVKLYDLVGVEYKILAESTDFKYIDQEILLEVGQLIDWGFRYTNLIEHKLVLARTQDISDSIVNHSMGSGGFGEGSTFGGGSSQ